MEKVDASKPDAQQATRGMMMEILNHPLVLQDANPFGLDVIEILGGGTDPPAELPLTCLAPDVAPPSTGLDSKPGGPREVVEVLGRPLVFADLINPSNKLRYANSCSSVFVKNFEDMLPEFHHFSIVFGAKKLLRLEMYTSILLGSAGR